MNRLNNEETVDYQIDKLSSDEGFVSEAAQHPVFALTVLV